jgi:membrane associated rhomboid family serine protease
MGRDGTWSAAAAWQPASQANGNMLERRRTRTFGGGFEMGKNAYMVIYFVLMVATIVGADFLFFRDHFVARLIANIAIVAVFAAVYFLFLKNL